MPQTNHSMVTHAKTGHTRGSWETRAAASLREGMWMVELKNGKRSIGKLGCSLALRNRRARKMNALRRDVRSC